jgi:iron complex outermembrane receptor protein
MKKLYFYLLIFFTILFIEFSNFVYGQTRILQGTVINAITNKPVSGLKVEIKGTGISAKSNPQGEYSFAIPDTLQSINFSNFNGLNLLEIKIVSPDRMDIYVSEIDVLDLTLEELLNIKVTTVSRFKQSADKTPNSVIVITEQQISARGYQDLSDVLKDIPGFDISDNAARFGEYYTLRGIQGNERILVLIDGHKLNPPTGTLLSVGNSISVGFAKQIEIIYGPGSAMFGADAYAGIINIISKDTHQLKNTATLNGSYASLSTIDAMFESHIQPTDNLSLTFFCRMYSSDGFDVVGTDTIYNMIKRYKGNFPPECQQPIRDFNIFFRADYKNITLGYFRQMFDEGNGYSQNPDKNLYSKENKWKFNTDNLWVSFKKELNKLGTITADINLIYFKLNNNTQFTKWVTAYKPDLAFSQYMTGIDLSYKGTTSLHKVFSDKFQFITGIDYEHIKSIPPYANDELFENSYKYEGARADSIKDLLTLRENRIAGFGQFIWSPIDNLDVVMGGRYDYSSRYKGTFNPRAGITYCPLKKTTLKFIYGRAFQAPSLFFQYEQWGSSTTVMLSTSEVKKLVDPTWELKNQMVTSYELSLSQQIGTNFRIKTSVYFNHLTDLIQRITFDTKKITYNKYYKNFTDGVRNENAGVQKIIGFNTELNYIITGRLEAYSYYCYTHGVSEELTGNVDIPRISENKIWLGATYNNLFNFLSISPRLRWVGEITNSNKVLFPSGKQKGNTSIDLNISANQLFGYLKIYAKFNNLLNQKINHAGLYQQTGGYLATIPQEGLRFTFGLEVNLGK